MTKTADNFFCANKPDGSFNGQMSLLLNKLISGETVQLSQLESYINVLIDIIISHNLCMKFIRSLCLL